MQAPPVYGNGSPSSAFTKRICSYIHEYILSPFSEWYLKRLKIASPPGMIFPLPLGLILKRHGRVHEQEGLAMNLARAMGVPAPHFVPFGSLGVPSACPSLLMNRAPVDLDVVAADFTRIIARMRSFAHPHGAVVCGVAGRGIHGPMIPGSPLALFADEDAFNTRLRTFVTFVRLELITGGVKSENMDAALEDHRARAETVERCLIALAPHALVFTHRYLKMHNIMIGLDGHVCGIIDWEGGAWLPEYWEFSIMATVSGGVYEQVLKWHQALA
ncbi:hypothetical protein C2E23DRAFT_874181 [Lenzites betulinus]|nr:hypothetical protein C2E23DRAFT_874181 [Lenzites betulinus]